MACGIAANEVGIISPYRSQLRLMSRLLSHHPDVEIHTVDKFQGRDKDCVIVSFVRSNAQLNVGDLLRDWRRLNVALTRARKKLIIIGSLTTLAGTRLLEEFIAYTSGKHWVSTRGAMHSEGFEFMYRLGPQVTTKCSPSAHCFGSQSLSVRGQPSPLIA
jgi:ATP-dependent exoDNAse (exonuclease V) beta subunit